MKKIYPVLFFLLFAATFLHAQTTEVLTNATIVKMVKAKLSDDIIIDEIGSTKANFDVSASALKVLAEQQVSEAVIQAMKKAAGPQANIENTAPTPPAAATSMIQVASIPVKDTLKQAPAVVTPTNPTQSQPATTTTAPAAAAPTAPQYDTPASAVIAASPVQVKEEKNTPLQSLSTTETREPGQLRIESTTNGGNDAILIEKTPFTLHAYSYVYPAKDLISFYNNQFSKLAQLITDWNNKLQKSLSKEQESLDAIHGLEKELRDQKNADAKPFSKDIVALQSKLTDTWLKHKSIKKDIYTEGKALVADMQKVSKETGSSIASQFKDISRNVKSVNSDPAAGPKEPPVVIATQKFGQDVTGFFAPVTMILVLYQNEIADIQQFISQWNEKVMNSFQQDSILRKQLEPLQSEMDQYQSTSKQDQKLKKKEISSLKKQIDAIEKNRKSLAKQMDSDSGKLADTINKMSEEAQVVVKQRFDDIILSIDHYYKDKFNEY